MINNILFGVIGVLMLVIVGIGGVSAFGSHTTIYKANSGLTTNIHTNVTSKTIVTNTTTQTTQTSGSATYTMANVAHHNSGSSCWTAINGGVYDVTSWINQHPGGPGAILSLCGTDGSTAFNGQHGGQRRPEQELASFKIGILK